MSYAHVFILHPTRQGRNTPGHQTSTTIEWIRCTIAHRKQSQLSSPLYRAIDLSLPSGTQSTSVSQHCNFRSFTQTKWIARQSDHDTWQYTRTCSANDRCTQQVWVRTVTRITLSYTEVKTERRNKPFRSFVCVFRMRPAPLTGSTNVSPAVAASRTKIRTQKSRQHPGQQLPSFVPSSCCRASIYYSGARTHEALL